MEKAALSLKEAASYLGVSYTTIFKNRHHLGFRLPCTRKWIIPLSRLENLSNFVQNDDCNFKQVGIGENSCQSINETAIGGFRSQRQAARELDNLLKQRIKGKRKSSMIG